MSAEGSGNNQSNNMRTPGPGWWEWPDVEDGDGGRHEEISNVQPSGKRGAAFVACSVVLTVFVCRFI